MVLHEGGVMFIMPFAREVRLAQTKPTRAPVLGLSLCPPPVRGSQACQHSPRPLRAAGKRGSDARFTSFTSFLSTFCPAIEYRDGCRACGRKLGALYKKPVAIPKVRLTPFCSFCFDCVRYPSYSALGADLMPRKTFGSGPVRGTWRKGRGRTVPSQRPR